MAITRIVNQWNGLTTASAPALTGQAGSFITVLDFCLVTTMGWTKPYSGTNTAVYKQPAGSQGVYLWVDDTGTTNARIRGWEVASGVGVGINPFPNDAQVSGGDYVFKSSTADGTNRAWYFISNGKTIHMAIASDIAVASVIYGTASSISGGFSFGDFTSKRYGGPEPMTAYLVAAVIASAATTNSRWNWKSVAGWAVGTGMYCCRPFTGLGGSQNVGVFTDGLWSGGGGSDGGNEAAVYPSQIYGGLILTRKWFVDPSHGPRGWIPGHWWPGHPRPLNHGEVFSGSAGSDVSGRSFEAVNGAQAGQAFFETSDTWD